MPAPRAVFGNHLAKGLENPRRRTVVTELSEVNLTWGEAERGAQDRVRRKDIVIYSTGDEVDYLFHSHEWSMSNFPRSFARNIKSHSMKNLGFHSLLRWKMSMLSILTTSLMHFLFKRLGECTFWTWEWNSCFLMSCRGRSAWVKKHAQCYYGKTRCFRKTPWSWR